MRFDDLNDIVKLTHKADFIKLINENPEYIKDGLAQLSDQGIMDFDEAFDMIIRYIESRKMHISEKIIEDLFTYTFEAYNHPTVYLNNYIELSKFYVNNDSEVNRIQELFTQDFIEHTDVYFVLMIAAYYLNLLVEKSENIQEITRVNEILKMQITAFKLRTGRE